MREMKRTMRAVMVSNEHRRSRTLRFGRTACLLPANRGVTSALVAQGTVLLSKSVAVLKTLVEAISAEMAAQGGATDVAA